MTAKIYKVQQGQCLDDVAIHLYGDVAGIALLFANNPGLNYESLYPGQELKYFDNDPVINKKAKEELAAVGYLPATTGSMSDAPVPDPAPIGNTVLLNFVNGDHVTLEAPAEYDVPAVVILDSNGNEIELLSPGETYELLSNLVDILYSDSTPIGIQITAPGNFSIPKHDILDSAGTILYSDEYDNDRTVNDASVLNSLDEEVATVLAEGSVIIDDQRAVNSEGTELGTAAVGHDIVIADITVTLPDGSTQTFAAGISITADFVALQLVNSIGQILLTISTYPSGGNIPVADAVAKNTAGTALATAPAGNDVVVPDITLTQADGSNVSRLAGINLSCAFPTLYLRNSAGVVKATISAYPSLGFINAVNAAAKNSAGTTLATAPYGDDVIVPDITLTQADGSSVPRLAGINLSCAFPALVLRNTAGTNLQSISSYPSSGIITAPNVVVNRDGVFYSNAPAGTTINVPSAVVPSGILYQRLFPTQRLTYRTGDIGWHVQNGTFNYSDPANPATIQCLDYSTSDFNWTLKFNNAFGNKFRFTNSVGSEALDGKLNFTGSKTYTTGGGINFYVIDHLTGLGFYVANLGNTGQWNNSIDVAHAQRAGNLLGFNDWFPWFDLVYRVCSNIAVGTGNISSLMKAGIVSGHTETFSWLPDTDLTATTQALYHRQGGNITSIAKTNNSVTTVYVARKHY